MVRGTARMALVALLILVFAEFELVNGQSNQTSRTIIANSDPQITYSPNVCSDSTITNCLGTWWDLGLSDGSAIKMTAGPSSRYNNAQTTMTYSFYGSSLEIYGLADTNGANIVVQIDNFLAIVNTSTGIGGASLQPMMIYNYTGLDPGTVHTLSIGWSASGDFKPRSFAFFDRLVVGDYQAVLPPSTAPSGSPTITSASQEQTPSTIAAAASQLASSTMKPGAIAGIVIAVLVSLLLIGIFAFCIFRQRRRPRPFQRRPQLSHVKVMIESQETSRAESIPSPTQRESWKARPHLSLPPAYGYTTHNDSEKSEPIAEKGASYLDLESGHESVVSSSYPSSISYRDASDKRVNRKSSVSALPASPSGSSCPPSASLRIDTRKSLLSGRRSIQATIAETEASPVTPFTPYCVATATVARPQNAQLVPKSSLSSGDLCVAPVISTIPLPPLPPLPPIPSPKEEKRRFTKRFSSFRRSRKSSRAGRDEANRRGVGSSTLEVELDAMGSSRPSFDSMSVMTRSVPPPYTLHENSF